jgi:hypothetical protein
MSTTRKRRVIVFAVVAALLAAGAAYATIPDSNGVIHGCSANKDGSLRVIDLDAGQSCGTKESPLDWNSKGPAGPQGPIGPTGPTGPTGPQGPAGSEHGYQTNSITKVPGTMADTKVISLSGLPDGVYMVFAQLNVLGDGGDLVYCSVNGTNVPQYTNETELSATGLDDAEIVTSAKLSGGGNNTIDVSCEISSTLTDTAYSSLSAVQLSALN